MFFKLQYLEINSESLYLENLKDEFPHINSHFQNNINLCCSVESINRDKNSKLINVILENIFDLNSIILEISQNDEIFQNLYVNCVYLFINFYHFVEYIIQFLSLLSFLYIFIF